MGIFGRRPQVSRDRFKKAPPPSKPKSFFEEKSEWSRSAFRRRLRTASPSIPGTAGGLYTRRQRESMVEEIFPWERFKSHISESEAKRRLRELRGEEYKAGTGAEKSKLKRQREYLEKELGLKGKY